MRSYNQAWVLPELAEFKLHLFKKRFEAFRWNIPRDRCVGADWASLGLRNIRSRNGFVSFDVKILGKWEKHLPEVRENGKHENKHRHRQLPTPSENKKSASNRRIMFFIVVQRKHFFAVSISIHVSSFELAFGLCRCSFDLSDSSEFAYTLK